jgi:hypothetical protein
MCEIAERCRMCDTSASAIKEIIRSAGNIGENGRAVYKAKGE